MRTPEEEAAYIEHLVSEIKKFKAEKAQLEVEIARLKEEKGLTREDLTFNQHTGVWSDASGRLYCPTCLNMDKWNPLKVETHGWRCTAGSHYFSNPDAPPPTMNVRRVGRI